MQPVPSAAGVVDRVEAGVRAPFAGGLQHACERVAVEGRHYQGAADVEVARPRTLQGALDAPASELAARARVVEKAPLAVASVQHHRGGGERLAGAHVCRVQPPGARLASEDIAQQVVTHAPAERRSHAEPSERRGRREGAAPRRELHRIDQPQQPGLGRLVHRRGDRVGDDDPRAQNLGMRVRRHGDGPILVSGRRGRSVRARCDHTNMCSLITERPQAEPIPLERLEGQICELAAHVNAATCRWLELVGEFDRREGWAVWGAKSCSHWLGYRCGLSPAAARDHVRVARLIAGLPGIRAAFARGELCYSQVRASRGWPPRRPRTIC